MPETKPWYLSKTIIATIISMVVALLAEFHVKLPAIDQGQLTDMVLAITTGVAGIVAIYGRATAKKQLTAKELPFASAVLLLIGVYAAAIALMACAFGCRTVNIGCTVAEISQTSPTGQTRPTSPTLTLTQTATVPHATATQGKETPFDLLRGLGQGATVPVGQTASATVSGQTKTQSSATERAATATANPPASEKGVQSVPASAPAG